MTDTTAPPTPTPLPPWPAKFESLREHQVTAVMEILQAFEDGAKIVWLNAPTGSGKTAIGEAVRRAIYRKLAKTNESGQALYICSDKSLQDQFAKDFPYGAVLKGKSNYPTELAGYRWPQISAEDCTGGDQREEEDGARINTCDYCAKDSSCPYKVAKQAAIEADLAVLNTAYYLTDTKRGVKRGNFGNRALVIIDECDVLENAVLSSVSLEISERNLEVLQLPVPAKGARRPRVIQWLLEVEERIASMLELDKSLKGKRKMQWKHLVENVAEVRRELVKEEEHASQEEYDPSGEPPSKWVRIYDSRPGKELSNFEYKPVLVRQYGNKRVWQHADRFLCMSASIISPEELSASLGVTDEWAVVNVPMTFPVEHRPIIAAPVISNTFKNKHEAPEKIANAVWRIMEKHQGERVLVHAVSYHFATDLTARLNLRQMEEGGDRLIQSYTEGRGKAEALRRHLATEGGVIVAPSMDRGVDLPDDACRVIVVAKMPYLGLKDRRVSDRMRMRDPDGQLWYTVQNVRSFVQMIGRGVRHEDDWCTTYVIDAEFMKLWRQDRRLLPEWVREAVDTRQSVKWLLQ